MAKKPEHYVNRGLYDLTESDLQWTLCHTTGIPYIDLLGIIAEVNGNARQFARAIGQFRLQQPKSKYGDYGYWQMMCDWIKIFIPQWEAEVKRQLAQTNLDSDQILTAVAKALSVNEEQLKNFVENQEALELFFEAQRKSLGMLAERALWQGVMEGDQATARWLAQRLRPDIYGDKLGNMSGDTPRVIRIIEQEFDANGD